MITIFIRGFHEKKKTKSYHIKRIGVKYFITIILLLFSNNFNSYFWSNYYYVVVRNVSSNKYRNFVNKRKSIEQSSKGADPISTESLFWKDFAQTSRAWNTLYNGIVHSEDYIKNNKSILIHGLDSLIKKISIKIRLIVTIVCTTYVG